MSALVILGEALYDLFGQPGKGLAESAGFTPRMGGAPANLAVSAARIGGDVGFIGRVGADGFGTAIKAFLSGQRVDVTHLVQDPQRATMLAMVALPTPETPEFLLLPGANVALCQDDISRSYLAAARVLAFGSVTLAWPCREAALHAARMAGELGVEVVFDVNLRPNIWSSLDEARAMMFEAIKASSVVKLNLEEADFLFGGKGPEGAARALMDMGVKLVCISRGRNGSQFYTQAVTAHHEGFRVRAVDATGSGDAFLAGICVSLCDRVADIDEMNAEDLARVAEFSNACGALVATHLGAMEADFSRDDVTNLMQTRANND